MRKYIAIGLLLGISHLTIAEDLDTQIENAIVFSQRQLQETVWEINADTTRHPKVTDPVTGKWNTSNRGGWTSGFFAGTLWQIYELTQDLYHLDCAQAWTWDLESEKNNNGDHDIGFRIFCSFGQGHRLTGDSCYQDVIVTAANTLATRYNRRIGAIRSWSWGSWNYPVIIDNMMNLELLLWAAENGGDSTLRDIAIDHALTTIDAHIREDGSTYHVVDFDNSGNIVSQETRQGYDDESTWSRGQAWGIYGFTVMYRYTQDPVFLETALNLADYFIDNLPDDFIPFYDFEDPGIPNVIKDASAAAIACAALFELQTFTTDEKYGEAARNILTSLTSDTYLAKTSVHSSLIQRASQWKGDEERGTIYADYYFLEAIRRYQAYDTKVEALKIVQPITLRLLPNYPNPFNSVTSIPFSLENSSAIQIRIFDTTGRMVQLLVNEKMQAGFHTVLWHAKNVSSGIYFIHMKTENQNIVKKCILLN